LRLEDWLRPNDWPLRDFLITVAMVQLSVWGMLGMGGIGLDMGFLRALLTIGYMILTPGFVVLRVLRVHSRGTAESFVCAVGLSLSAAMFLGLVANIALPVMGLPTPISTIPLVSVYTVALAILCVIAYLRDGNYRPTQDPGKTGTIDRDAREIRASIRVAMGLGLLVVLTILGSYLQNLYRFNMLTVGVILAVTFLVLLVGCSNALPVRTYPLAIFAISLSLLYHRALISSNLWGWDVFHEFYLADAVISQSYWNATLAVNTNAMLSTVILAPSFSVVSGLSLTSLFKVVWPFLFSLVPVALYMSLSGRMKPRLAFLAMFFFVALYVFYGELPQVPRQEIAELFIALIVLTFSSSWLEGTTSRALVIIFSLSLVVSHYGTSYIFMGLLIVANLMLMPGWFRTGGRLRNHLTASYTALVLAFGYFWYAYVSGSSNFASIVQLGNHVASNLVTDFLSPRASQPLHIILTANPSFLRAIHGALHLVSQVFITIGIVAYARGKRPVELNEAYAAMAGASFILLLASAGLPYLASAFNTSRIYQVSLMFLAPFLVFGAVEGYGILREIATKSKRVRLVPSGRVSPGLSVFLAVFLIFNSGLAQQVANEAPVSISLSEDVDFPRFLDAEMAGAQWLSAAAGEAPIYADEYRYQIFLAQGLIPRVPSEDFADIPIGSFFYLGAYNIEHRQLLVHRGTDIGAQVVYVAFGEQLSQKSLVFDSGNCRIYFYQQAG